MKTYIKTTLTILISGMLFSSCEDQLNQANPNQATEDTFWKDETDFNLALTFLLYSTEECPKRRLLWNSRCNAENSPSR